MSRQYAMSLEIENVSKEKSSSVQEAADLEWNFDGDEWRFEDGTMAASGEGELAGGELEKGFADRLAKAIWKANGGFCLVRVYATCMEDLPFETHERGRENYDTFMKEERVDGNVL